MTLNRKFIGQINLPKGEVTLTDPGYDKNTWCAATLKVRPGTYDCFAYTGKDPDWGKRVWINQIVLRDSNVFGNNTKKWECVSTSIGVDAGLAGFFADKPDFNQEEWEALCSWMGNRDEFIKTFDNGTDGFWTSSGVGDGCYEAYALRNADGEIIAVEIRF